MQALDGRDAFDLIGELLDRVDALEAFGQRVAIAYGQLTGDYNDRHCIQYALEALWRDESRLEAILAAHPTRGRAA